MSPVVVEPSSASLSRDGMYDLVRDLAERSQFCRGKERRREVRQLVAAPALIQLLNDELSPVGPPLEMVIRDISSSGIGLLYSKPIAATYLSAEIPKLEEFGLIAMVLRCREVGAYYDIGCRFLTARDMIDLAHEAVRRRHDSLALVVDQLTARLKMMV